MAGGESLGTSIRQIFNISDNEDNTTQYNDLVLPSYDSHFITTPDNDQASGIPTSKELEPINLDNGDINADWIKYVTRTRKKTIQQNSNQSIGLTPDWQEQLIRAYSMFGIKRIIPDIPHAPINPEFEEEHPRGEPGTSAPGRFVDKPDATIPEPEPRADLDALDIEKTEPPEYVPLKRPVSREQFEAALSTLIPQKLQPRAGSIHDNPEHIRLLLRDWLQISGQYELEGEPPPRKRKSWEMWDPVLLETAEQDAKMLVSQNISDATADSITLQEMQNIFSVQDNMEHLPGGKVALARPGKKSIPIDPLNPPDDARFFVEDHNTGLIVSFPAPMVGENLDSVREKLELYRENDSGDLEFFPTAEIGTPEADTMIRDYYTSRLINFWAQTSNDSNPFSLAAQQIAEELAPIGANANEWDITPELQQEMEFIIAAGRNVFQQFLGAQKAATMALLSALGSNRIPLYRGALIETQDLLDGSDMTADELEANPITSENYFSRQMEMSTVQRPISPWATGLGVAGMFAKNLDRPNDPDVHSMIVAADIPIEEILSTTLTGYGAYAEQEMVALANSRTAIGTLIHNTVGPASFKSTERAEKFRKLINTK